ncbi:hypothetical protein [Nitrosomonas ureae]|uniref:Uncharacterized protein n=1 Tax=Nitrosomonas ureae TaxID=44577 RepID=A0A1H2ENU5_9PROT|nr:hypothetical protein [Nitrosomonas ureae]ALQ51904.1 hypothetical protein ATY38_12150 [Nitrosomonas ureae]SDT96800.1 hypothetical protein SAMN05216406_11440 [Nitrosomonas ureae]
MKEVSERMNLKFGEVAGAYVIYSVRNINEGMRVSFYNLTQIYSKFNLYEEGSTDYRKAAQILHDFCLTANEDTGYTVSVWFDK